MSLAGPPTRWSSASAPRRGFNAQRIGGRLCGPICWRDDLSDNFVKIVLFDLTFDGYPRLACRGGHIDVAGPKSLEDRVMMLRVLGAQGNMDSDQHSALSAIGCRLQFHTTMRHLRRTGEL